MEMTADTTLKEIIQEAGEQASERPASLIRRVYWWLRGRHVASEYDDYYEDVDYKTFRCDPAIWNEYRGQRPTIEYYRTLQTVYEQLLQKFGDLLFCDLDDLKNRIDTLHRENCRLEKELAIAQGQAEVLQERLDDAMRWQTAQGRKNAVLTSQGLDIEQPIQKALRDGKGFVSNNGASKQENMMLCMAYHANDWNVQEIAEELSLSQSTVRAYLSTIKKHCRIELVQGIRWIKFDKEYGNNQWNLAFYSKIEAKFPDDATSHLTAIQQPINSELTAI